MPQRHFIATGHLHTLHTSTVLYQPFPENADDMPRLISALCMEWRNLGIAGCLSLLYRRREFEDRQGTRRDNLELACGSIEKTPVCFLSWFTPEDDTLAPSRDPSRSPPTSGERLSEACPRSPIYFPKCLCPGTTLRDAPTPKGS